MTGHRRQTPASARIVRVAEFLRQWAMMRDKTDLIYGVHADIHADMANLLASDLRGLLLEIGKTWGPAMTDHQLQALRVRAEVAEDAANACVDARWFTGTQADADDAMRAYRISKGELPDEIELERDR